jgi:hypothetical protein
MSLSQDLKAALRQLARKPLGNAAAEGDGGQPHHQVALDEGARDVTVRTRLDADTGA